MGFFGRIPQAKFTFVGREEQEIFQFLRLQAL